MALSIEAIVGLVAIVVAMPPALLGLRALYIKARRGEFLSSADTPNYTYLPCSLTRDLYP